MKLVYVLLSSTFGMHQYTADLANRMARHGFDTHLATTQHFPEDRYAPEVQIHRIAHTKTTGLSAESINLAHLKRIQTALIALNPTVVHFTGPHLWNAALIQPLQNAGIAVIHSLHDLDPHVGRRFGRLLHLWNRRIINSGATILVHGYQYQQRLLTMGLPPDKVAHTHLLHLFLGHRHVLTLTELESGVTNHPQPPDEAYALFFGRIEKYKGVDYMLTAFAQLSKNNAQPPMRLILAGPGNLSDYWVGNLPTGVEIRNHLIQDQEAIDLFQQCSLVVLPYIDATQSALIAAAYFFKKPVMVTRAGALEEYVTHNETGFIAEPDHPPSMARLLEKAFATPGLLSKMGQKGRAWYDKIRAEEMNQLLAIYDGVARQNRNAKSGHSLNSSLPST